MAPLMGVWVWTSDGAPDGGVGGGTFDGAPDGGVSGGTFDGGGPQLSPEVVLHRKPL